MENQSLHNMTIPKVLNSFQKRVKQILPAYQAEITIKSNYFYSSLED